MTDMVRREKVTRVIDGDTFETDRRKHSVRLANVDAPEKGKPGSAKATKALKELIQGQEVSIETVARDKYWSYCQKLWPEDFKRRFYQL